MKIVFMGTPDFALGSLKALIESKHSVEAVFTQPDKPVGRKQILTPPPVKSLALENGIKVYQPEKIKGSDALKIINDINPDVIVVVAYGKILPAEILTSARFGAINVHASLLPEYRGAAPIQWAVLNGDSETGVCIMQMDEGLDTGDIILCEKTEIGENETSAELFDRLSVIGANALIKALDLIESGKAVKTPQPKGEYTYASMIDKSFCPIDWNKSALEIHNQVRGLQTWPVATTVIGNKTVKIHKTAKCDIKGGKAGEVMESTKRLIISCGDGKCLEILELQSEGKRKMDAKAFLAGNKIETNTVIGG
ncbi:MAG: methionyl-tRNA formyltransferase [Eubacterium sp.]|nr:methionyl-tRNA formyltransferase [Eubacterium sp.]